MASNKWRWYPSFYQMGIIFKITISVSKHIHYRSRHLASILLHFSSGWMQNVQRQPAGRTILGKQETHSHKRHKSKQRIGENGHQRPFHGAGSQHRAGKLAYFSSRKTMHSTPLFTKERVNRAEEQPFWESGTWNELLVRK